MTSPYVKGIRGIQTYLSVGRDVAERLWREGLRDEALEIGPRTRILRTDVIDRFMAAQYKPVRTVDSVVDKFMEGLR